MFPVKNKNKVFIDKRNGILSRFKKSLTELQGLVNEIDTRQKTIDEEKNALDIEQKANESVKELSLHSINALLNILEPNNPK